MRVPSKGVIQVVAGVAVGVYVVILVIQRGPDGSLIAPFGLIVFLSTVAFFVFDRWVWRWKLVRQLHGRPFLDGTWHGEIKSSWAPDGEPTTVSDVFLVFRQRFWATSFRLLTAESESSPVTAALVSAPDGVYDFSGTYRNEPEARHQATSAIHYGTLSIRIPTTAPSELIGRYWTLRRTTGDLKVRRLSENHVGSHGAGLELLGRG